MGLAADQLGFFKEIKGRVDHPGAGAVAAIEEAFDLADQVVAVAGLFGQHRQQQQLQVAGGKHAGAAVATFTAVTTFEAVMPVAMFAVGMMVTHGGISVCVRCIFRYYSRYILNQA
ncbi:hypothetical protein D3C85_1628100 [compost metagenome]